LERSCFVQEREMAVGTLGDGYCSGELGRWSPGSGTAQPVAGDQPKRPGRSAWRSRGLPDGSTAGRAIAIARHAAFRLPARLRRHLGWTDPTLTARLSELLDRWNDKVELDDTAFHEQFLGDAADARTARHLRATAERTAKAGNQGQLADAARHLASAIQEIGVERWPVFLDRAVERARLNSSHRGADHVPR
jgi:hypothetical protein